MIWDSHQGSPDAVNAIEKVLIHRNHNRTQLGMLIKTLQEREFDLRVDELLHQEYPELKLAEESEWHSPYLDKIVAFKMVDTLESAIAWISHYSSGHANCLATESYVESYQFQTRLRSAAIYINTSPRFYRYSEDRPKIALAMSTQASATQGVVSLETFTTEKRIVHGSSQPLWPE
jgi:glutamate-5-semialdehyde dehydrogenase